MVSAIVGFFTGNWFTHEIIGGIVAGILSSLLTILYLRFDYWRKYKKPWYTEYEPRRNETFNRIDIEHSNDPSRIQLRLRFNARVHVSHIMVDLTGGSNPPEILGLYDWNTPESLPVSAQVFVERNERGAWYWHYHNGLLRTPGPKELQNTICVGLKVQTREAFAGNLLVQLAYEERKQMPKPEYIPFHVTTKR
jgi:hypothetical protein